MKVKKLRCEYKKNPIGIDVQAPRLCWQIDSDSRGVLQSAYQIQVSKNYDFCGNIVWDTGRVESDQSIQVEYEGEALKSRTRYYYRARVWDNRGNASDWSETAFWEMGILDSGEWKAQWITPGIEPDPLKFGPCPMLRSTFDIRGKVKTARIYATALGLYEIHLNGSRVGDCLLAPGWTSYNKRLQYQTYDITEQLKSNKNSIGVILAPGWYMGHITWRSGGTRYGDKLAALVQMHVEYEDGTEETVISDSDWRSSTGPILMSDIYAGETYDARLEKTGWDTAEYDDGGWHGVSVLEYPKSTLTAQENVPVRAIEKIKPISIVNTPAGETVLDMGQNMVGFVRFKVSGQAGSEVVLQHAEVLDKNGNFYTDNLREAKQTVKYILKGTGEEIYQPVFSFQGFRYVKIDGYPGIVSLENFTGVVIHSDMESTGSFMCSDELVNQLQHNILWGQKGNFVDVPTDCPQRDERLGWTGDAQVFIRTAGFNMNVAAFFTKWLKDLKADQSEEQGVPAVIPNILGENAYSSSAWGDAAAICPWTIYLCYGDRRILEEQYESMRLWVEYIRRQGDNEYLWNTGFHFGDWLGLDAKEGSYVGATASDCIATAFYAYSTEILAKSAEILGKTEDAGEYKKLHQKILDNFRKEFVTPGGRLAVPTQTAHVLALMFGLVEEKDRKRTADTLARYLEENKCHLTTGFVGTPYLCHVLSANGYNDLAYKLLMQKDYPSWLYQITKGATTIWEHWDGIKEDGSFWSEDMNSFNHYAYGAIGDWMYRVVAGIDTDTDKPGYKRIYINPKPNAELSFAEATLDSMYGEIKSAWHMTEESMEMAVVIPPNTTAGVILPFACVAEVFESGKNLGLAEGITSYEQADEGVRLELGSGEYKFTYKAANTKA